MAKSKKFYQKEYSKHIGATILLITSFLSLTFMSCGVPLGVLMDRNVERACNTLWGYRRNCWNAAYDWRAEHDTCPDRRTRWETAEAFSVMALFSLLFNIGCAWAMLGNSHIKTITTMIAIFSVACTTVPWSIVTALYYSHYCGEYTYTHVNRKFGTGYILMVVSFAIQCVGLILFMFIEPEDSAAEAAEAEEKKSLNEKKTAKPGSQQEEQEEE